MSETMTYRKWGLCQGACGVVDLATLIPCENEPPGLCPTCRNSVCDCDSCLRTAIEETYGGAMYEGLHMALNILMDKKAAPSSK